MDVTLKHAREGKGEGSVLDRISLFFWTIRAGWSPKASWLLLADDGLPHWGGPGAWLLRWRDGFGSRARDAEAVCVLVVIRPPAEERIPRPFRRRGSGGWKQRGFRMIDKSFSLYLVIIASAGWTGFRLDWQFRTHYCLLFFAVSLVLKHRNE